MVRCADRQARRATRVDAPQAIPDAHALSWVRGGGPHVFKCNLEAFVLAVVHLLRA
jgi:hypothetical protein